MVGSIFEPIYTAMSKQTQISLDFGPEEQSSAPTGDKGTGNDPARHYMAAGGVGVRVKSYKQTPAPGGGDLFDTAAASEQATPPAAPKEQKPAVAVEAAETATAAGPLAVETVRAAEPETEKLVAAENMAEIPVVAAPVAPAPLTEKPPAAAPVAEKPLAVAPLDEKPIAVVAEAVKTVAAPTVTVEAGPSVAEPVAVKPAAAEAVPAVAEAGPAAGPVAVKPVATKPEAEDGPLPKRQVSAKNTGARQKSPSPQTPSKRGRKSLKQVSAEADLIEIPADEVLFSKQYYTMGEVSEMFRVNQSLLRFWESEFDVLQPRKNKKGDRYFRPVDIKNLHLIYHLLRQKKYTIEGAKEFLKKNKKADERFEVIKRLQEIKSFLLEMKAQI